MGLRASKLRKFTYKRIGHGRAPPRSNTTAPKGYVPICVGLDGDKRRFLVHTTALDDGEFVELLRRSADEYGFGNQGVLRIRCEAAEFEQWMRRRTERKNFRVSGRLCK